MSVGLGSSSDRCGELCDAAEGGQIFITPAVSGLLLDGLVGYGYRTWLAAIWLLGFWLVGWAVFDRAHNHQELVLAKPGEAHPSFQGAIYSLDTLLPVVDLRQQAVWLPHGGVQWWASASILAGWILTFRRIPLSRRRT